MVFRIISVEEGYRKGFVWEVGVTSKNDLKPLLIYFFQQFLCFFCIRNFSFSQFFQ
jgi:hypothetical protein